MEYEFSALIDGVQCYIRSAKRRSLLQERVSDRPHKHFYIEFHCVFSGTETILLPQEKREICLQPGQVLLLPRGVYHGVTTGEGTVERLCFNFSAEGNENSHIMRYFRSISEITVFENKAATELIRMCHDLRLRGELPLGDGRQGMLLLNAVLELFGNLPRESVWENQETSRSQQQRWIMEEYIERKFATDEGLKGMAETLYLSQRQTRTLVKKFFGEDFKDIIIRRRMEIAEILLEDTAKSLEEVARQVGYQSYSGFQLCFKKYFGITPSQRREQIVGK